MQDVSGHLIELISKQLMTTMGCLVDHIYLDNNTFKYSSIKEQYALLYYLEFLNSDCVHIYINNLI
jgi:hypothetical protein